jgi:hypothetical protein
MENDKHSSPTITILDEAGIVKRRTSTRGEDCYFSFEIMKWIIFFCCYIGQANEPDGHIIISEDSVTAFNMQWEVVPLKGTFLEGGGDDKVWKARLQLRTIVDNTPVIAFLNVMGERVEFTIPNQEIAIMKQLPHKKEYYPVELE